MTKRLFTLLSLMLALAPRAAASGFQLREQSASGQGNAFAGASAGAQDITSMFWNPATIPLYPGLQVAVGASWVRAHMDLSNASGSRASGFQPGDQTISGGPDQPNAVNQPVLPALYVTWGLSDQISLGLSVNVPFGLITDYPSDFVGRYYGLRTSLKTYDIAPALAWRPAPDWTFGVALVARKAEATISNAVDFGAIGNGLGVPGFVPGGADQSATLSGDAWAFGYKAGFTWQATPDLRFGAGYQARTTIDIKGNIGYSSVPSAFAGSITNSAARAKLDLPACASAGFIYAFSPAFSVQGEVAWTGWSVFKELRVSFASGQPDDVTEENWKDTMFYSLGAIWKLTPLWAVKAGLAYDRSPVDDRTRTPRIPDSSRTWISAGIAWSPSDHTTLDFGATQIFAPTVHLGLESGTSQADPNYYRGNLTGTYKVGVTVLALSARHRF
ncbi:MAG: outer membrane protein transport protein [Holophaga sp.]|nr:outer membrane protein transport protein [Holophaga sp.]